MLSAVPRTDWTMASGRPICLLRSYVDGVTRKLDYRKARVSGCKCINMSQFFQFFNIFFRNVADIVSNSASLRSWNEAVFILHLAETNVHEGAHFKMVSNMNRMSIRGTWNIRHFPFANLALSSVAIIFQIIRHTDLEMLVNCWTIALCWIL